MPDRKVLSDEEEEEEDSEPVVIVTKRKSSIKIVSDSSGGAPELHQAAVPAQEPPAGYQQLTVEASSTYEATAPQPQFSPQLPAALQQPQQRASPSPAGTPVRPISPQQPPRPITPVQQQPRPVTPIQQQQQQQQAPRPVTPVQQAPRPTAPQQQQQQFKPPPQVAQQQQQAPFVQTQPQPGQLLTTPPWSPQGSPGGAPDQVHPVYRQVPMKPAAPLVMPEPVLLRPLQQQAQQAPPPRVKAQDDFGWRQGDAEGGQGRPERQTSRLGSVWPPPPGGSEKDHGPPVNKIKVQDETSWVQQESVTDAHASQAAPWVRNQVGRMGKQWPPPESEMIKENLPVERTLRPQWPPPADEAVPSSQVYQKIALQQVHSQVAKQKQYFGSGGQIKPDEGYESEPQQQQQQYQQQQVTTTTTTAGGRPGVPAKPGVPQKPAAGPGAAVFQNGPAAGGGAQKGRFVR